MIISNIKRKSKKSKREQLLWSFPWYFLYSVHWMYLTLSCILYLFSSILTLPFMVWLSLKALNLHRNLSVGKFPNWYWCRSRNVGPLSYLTSVRIWQELKGLLMCPWIGYWKNWNVFPIKTSSNSLTCVEGMYCGRKKQSSCIVSFFRIVVAK